MMIELQGNYFLKVQVAGNIMNLQPGMIREVSITQDIDRFLPSFRISFMDSGGVMTNVLPYDREAGKISIEIGSNMGSNLLNRFEFKVMRRNPTADGFFEMSGLLDVDLFAESYARGMSGDVKSNLERIALKELGVDRVEIGESLRYARTIIQPNWSNSKLLNYLKQNLMGRGGEAGFKCFLKNVQGEIVFVFNSIESLFSGPTAYNFIVAEVPYEGHYPILETSFVDNSPLISEFSAKEYNYGYFDTDTGLFTTRQISIDDCPSLTELHLVNKDDNSSGNPSFMLGRENDFHREFEGRAKNIYYDRMLNLVNMWATTWGLPNISPGDVVKVVFGEELKHGNSFAFQHSGNWLVKRVVHLIDNTFATRLLLTRTGIDTNVQNLLVVAKNRKKK